MKDAAYYSAESCDLAAFREQTSRQLTKADAPNAAAIEKNVPLYDVPNRTLADPKARTALMAEWASVLRDHSGVLVIRQAVPDHAALDAATAEYEAIIAEEKAATGAKADHFAAAGGMQFLMRELLSAGLLHGDVSTVLGDSGLEPYTCDPFLNDDRDGVIWRPTAEESGNPDIIRPASDPFSSHGGLQLLKGNLGNSVIKVSALKAPQLKIKAPAVVFNSQDDLLDKFKAGELEKDFVAVVRFQGPQANGMPELHKLTPSLGVLQDRGFKVALITDGRMSGASGKVPAAIHLSPEALEGGAIAKIQDGDVIELDAEAGVLQLHISDEELAARPLAECDLSGNAIGMGRDLFSNMRALASGAETGASILF